MKALINIYLLIMLIMAASCSDEKLEKDFILEMPDELGQDNYNIYGAIIQEISDDDVVVLRQQSTNDVRTSLDLGLLLQDMDGVEKTTYSNFITENTGKGIYFNPSIKGQSHKVELISDEEHSYYFIGHDINQGWKLFNDKYGKQLGTFLYEFSKIGYNPGKNQAIILVRSYWSSTNSNLDGGHNETKQLANLYYLKKVRGIWQIKTSTINGY